MIPDQDDDNDNSDYNDECLTIGYRPSRKMNFNTKGDDSQNGKVPLQCLPSRRLLF